MRDIPVFSQRMDRLAAAFNRPTSQATKDAYRDALGGLSDDEFGAACSKALTACDRWPVPKVLLAFALEERGRLRAMQEGPNRTSNGPHCQHCGGLPRWTTKRMHLFHRQGCPLELRNADHEWDKP